MSSGRLRCVVDTNVARAANERRATNGGADVSEACVAECIKTLRRIMEDGHVFLDDWGLIFDEYRRNLSLSGQPGAGDMFVKWVHDHQYNLTWCTLVPITPKGTVSRGDPPTDFVEFPDHPGLRDFDPSDRKFVAVAAAHPEHPPILNATDTDWWIARKALEERGITVEFLCPEIEEIHKRKEHKGA